jgi:PKD repeat protein
VRTPSPRTTLPRIIGISIVFFVSACLVLAHSAPAGAQVPGGIQANPGGPYSGTVGQPVVFSGQILSSFGFGVTQFQWSFGDGGTGFGQTTSHVYLTPGTFIVTLTAVDPSGLSSSSSTSATIGGGVQPLGVSAGGPYSGSVGTLLTFAGSVSGGPSTLPFQYQYTWSFGDGSTASGLNTAHAYSVGGTYNVTLTVTSPFGQSGSASTTATIRQAISISAGTSTTGVVGRAVSFGATVTGATNPQVTWAFGDGGTSTGTFTTHVYTSPGTFTVAATA